MGDAAAGVPASLVRLFDYLAREAGIVYPWAGALLRDRNALRARAISFDTAAERPSDLDAWQEVLPADLKDRVMLPSFGLPGGVAWGESAQSREGELWHELQRRWLLWREQIIERGTVDPAAVRAELEPRELAWETSPHAGCGGLTPAQVVRSERAG